MWGHPERHHLLLDTHTHTHIPRDEMLPFTMGTHCHLHLHLYLSVLSSFMLLLFNVVQHVHGEAHAGCEMLQEYRVCEVTQDAEFDYGIPVDRNFSRPALEQTARPHIQLQRSTVTQNGTISISQETTGSIFEATVLGSNDDEHKAAISYCMQLVSNFWTSKLPVRVLVNFSSFSSEQLLGSAQATATTQLFGYDVTIALAKAIIGNALSGRTTYDVSMKLNSQARWYVGRDARPLGGTYDLVTVCLHEVIHGLFMSGSTFLVQRATNGSGYDGYVLPRNSVGRFDAFMANEQGCNVTKYGRQGRNRALGTVLTGNNLWFSSGTERIARLHAPRPYTSGSSLYHLSEDVYGDGASNDDLMTPAITTMYAQHNLGTVGRRMLSAMRDLPGTRGAEACRQLNDPVIDSSFVEGGDSANAGNSGASSSASGFTVKIGNSVVSGWIVVGAGLGGLALVVVSGMLIVRAVTHGKRDGSAGRRRTRMVQADDRDVVRFVDEGNSGGIV